MTDDPLPHLGDVEVHELERERHERIPHRRTADPDDVLPERKISGALPVVYADGEGFIGPFEKADRKVAKGEAAYEGHLLPFDVHTKRRGTVEIGRSAQFYFERIEGNVRLSTARIDSRGQLFVDLQETGAGYPQRTWTFRTIDLARYIEAGELRTVEEVNERAEAALEQLREKTGSGE